MAVRESIHGERWRPDILSEGRVDHSVLKTLGAHVGRHEATATWSDPRRHDEHRMPDAGGGERGRSQLYHLYPPLAQTGDAPTAAPRAPPH